MSASIDRFLATGDAAKKKKTKTPATIRRVGLRCTNCGGSHSTRSCPYEKKGGGLHSEDGTKIRTCSICLKPGHTKRNCPPQQKYLVTVKFIESVSCIEYPWTPPHWRPLPSAYG